MTAGSSPWMYVTIRKRIRCISLLRVILLKGGCVEVEDLMSSTTTMMFSEHVGRMCSTRAYGMCPLIHATWRWWLSSHCKATTPSWCLVEPFCGVPGCQLSGFLDLCSTAWRLPEDRERQRYSSSDRDLAIGVCFVLVSTFTYLPLH
jgi:hypothetical protein